MSRAETKKHLRRLPAQDGARGKIPGITVPDGKYWRNARSVVQHSTLLANLRSDARKIAEGRGVSSEAADRLINSIVRGKKDSKSLSNLAQRLSVNQNLPRGIAQSIVFCIANKYQERVLKK